jgi:predicted component of type VI protein secretion system
MINMLHGGQAPDMVCKYLQAAGMALKRPGEGAWSLTPEGFEFARAHDKTPAGEVFKMPQKEAKPPPRVTAPTNTDLRAVIKFLRQEDGQIGVRQETLNYAAEIVRRYIEQRAKVKATAQEAKKAKEKIT